MNNQIDEAIERYNKHFETEIFEQEFISNNEMIMMINRSIKENKTLEELYPDVFDPPVGVC